LSNFHGDSAGGVLLWLFHSGGLENCGGPVKGWKEDLWVEKTRILVEMWKRRMNAGLGKALLVPCYVIDWYSVILLFPLPLSIFWAL
jgi:hypothetical protein